MGRGWGVLRQAQDERVATCSGRTSCDRLRRNELRQARDERIVGFDKLPTPVGPRIKYGAGSEGEGVSFDKLRTNGVASSSTSSLRQAPFDKLPSTSSLRQAPFDKLPSTSSLRQAPFDKLPSTSSLRQAPFDKLPSTSSGRTSCDKLPSTSSGRTRGRKWWAIVDSNHGPQSYQDCALTV